MFNSTNGTQLTMPVVPAGGNGFGSGFGGDGAWFIWIILIIAIFGGWGYGNGFGGFGGGSRESTSVYEGYVLNNDMSMLNKAITDQGIVMDRKFEGISNGLCDGFYTQAQLINGLDKSIANGVYSLQNGLTQVQIADMQNTNAINAGITGLGTQMASCCCDQKYLMSQNFADLNYRMAEQSCQTRQAIADSTSTIVANQDANTRSILDFLTQDKIASLTSENAALKAAANNAAQTFEIVSQLKAPQAVPAYVVPNPYCNCNCNSGCGC